MTISVITTVRNEASSIGPLLDSLLSQSLAPDEIIVADGGSTDGTLDELAARERRGQVRVIADAGNRSAARNAAIDVAANDHIATIDAGCIADADWLRHLSSALRSHTWAAGFYRPVGATAKSTCIGLIMVPTRPEAERSLFMPSARSMAFHRTVWERAGGFPEDMEFAEDSTFDERALAAGHDPVFVPEALVDWSPPPTLTELARTSYRWGRGDGMARLGRHYPKRRLILGWGTLAAAVAVAAVAPWLVPVTVAPLAYDTARKTRFKYAHAAGASKYLWIPLAHLVSGYAGLVGYAVGSVKR